MGNYEQLKHAVSNVIKTNGNQEITGMLLQNTLLSIISSVGNNATFAGVATPATNPGTPDGPVFYLASEIGTYSNFSETILENPGLVVFYNASGTWQSLKFYECLQELGDSQQFPVSQYTLTNKLSQNDLLDELYTKKEYIGFSNIIKLPQSTIASVPYYNNIVTNNTYVGVRIKVKAGTIYICKIRTRVEGSSTKGTYEVIKSFTAQSEDEGKLKDLIFNKSIVLKENEYLGAKGSIYFGKIGGYTMNYIDANGFIHTDKDYSIGLNGIIGLSKISEDVKKNTEDITNLKNQSESSLYIELQNDSLKSDNGNFNIYNWEYTNNGIKPFATGSVNFIINNKIYHSDKRFMRVHVMMGTDTVLKIPVVYGGINAGEGASCFAVDFKNKKLIIYAVGNGQDDQATASGYTDTELNTEIIPDKVIGNREYIIELHKDSTNHILKLLDTLTGESCEVSHNGWGAGRQNQYYAFYCESGTLPTLSNFQVFSLNRPDVVFVGDSITEGVMVTDRTKRYAEQFRANNPNKKVVISARGGDFISGVLAKFATEYNIYRPKIMSVLIGANGGNTLENLTKLKTNCDAIGCTLVLHRRTCQQNADSHIAGNELIEQIGVNGARFDIATAKDNYPYVDASHPTPRYNSALYYDAGLHPNNEGNTKMYNRLLIDTPELFYN